MRHPRTLRSLVNNSGICLKKLKSVAYIDENNHPSYTHDPTHLKNPFPRSKQEILLTELKCSFLSFPSQNEHNEQNMRRAAVRKQKCHGRTGYGEGSEFDSPVQEDSAVCWIPPSEPGVRHPLSAAFLHLSVLGGCCRTCMMGLLLSLYRFHLNLPPLSVCASISALRSHTPLDEPLAPPRPLNQVRDRRVTEEWECRESRRFYRTHHHGGPGHSQGSSQYSYHHSHSHTHAHNLSAGGVGESASRLSAPELLRVIRKVTLEGSKRQSEREQKKQHQRKQHSRRSKVNAGSENARSYTSLHAPGSPKKPSPPPPSAPGAAGSENVQKDPVHSQSIQSSNTDRDSDPAALVTTEGFEISDSGQPGQAVDAGDTPETDQEAKHRRKLPIAKVPIRPDPAQRNPQPFCSCLRERMAEVPEFKNHKKKKHEGKAKGRNAAEKEAMFIYRWLKRKAEGSELSQQARESLNTVLICPWSLLSPAERRHLLLSLSDPAEEGTSVPRGGRHKLPDVDEAESVWSAGALLHALAEVVCQSLDPGVEWSPKAKAQRAHNVSKTFALLRRNPRMALRPLLDEQPILDGELTAVRQLLAHMIKAQRFN